VLKDAKWDGKKVKRKGRREGGRKKEIFKEQSKELQRRNFKFSL
jgi:hypothetical protein